ncbi:hypothetical protein CULC0102_0580 [Corynebacterium ulcerans 0102]|nr:hypothetical protein CULC0102_0580 [Corynebacterium ulcerans 0102]BBJ71439.1 hypothetical protein CULC0211_05730 [Corynebacterium ulcerans]
MLRQTNMVKHVNFDWQMPRDPFADDPNDPASFLDEDEPLPPLSEAEKNTSKKTYGWFNGSKKSYSPVVSTEFSSSAKTATRNTITTGTSCLKTSEPPSMASLAQSTSQVSTPTPKPMSLGIIA